MLANEVVSHIGYAYHRHGDRLFGIQQSDRLFHCLLLGQTGAGKSTLLLDLAKQDAMHRRGFCLIDPHGDMAAELSRSLDCEHIYWDVGDPNSPYGYNPLARVPEKFRPLVASGFVESLKQQWGKDAWGPRMENLLRLSVMVLLDQPRASLDQITRLSLDKEFRREAVARVRNDAVRQFWTVEFPKMNYLSTADGVQSISNKLGAFLVNPVVRDAVCQPRHPLRFRRIMDEGEIVIVNLAKGRLGTDVANVLGGLLVTNIMNAAFTRHDVPEAARRPFFLTVDEFPNLTTSVFAGMLSEARKHALGALLTAQHTSAIETSTFDSLIGNVGTILAMRLGAKDAPIIAKQDGRY